MNIRSLFIYLHPQIIKNASAQTMQNGNQTSGNGRI